MKLSAGTVGLLRMSGCRSLARVPHVEVSQPVLGPGESGLRRVSVATCAFRASDRLGV